MDESKLYDVECDSINQMLLKKEDLVKENVPVNVINDESYRRMRGIILQQKKLIKEQSDKIRSLEALID